MAVWVIRAGSTGENEEFALNGGVYGIGFDLDRSVTDFADYETLRNFIQETQHPDSINRAAAYASQLWRFADDMRVGEMVVLPRKRHKVIAVGRIVGEYVYNPDESQHPLPHTRKVEWLVQDVPRSNFDQDLQLSFNANQTIFQVGSVNAEARIQQVVSAYLENEQVVEFVTPSPREEPTTEYEEPVTLDFEQDIEQRILARIAERFSRHRLEYLVEEILKVEGYSTLRTTPGPDGGADILAGKGALGFENRLCVQVKSSASPIGISDYNRLQGNVHSFGADYGLLVSLSGFTKPVLDENRRSFFQIRLWDGDALVERLLDTYDDLPQEIRAAIPLEKRLVLDE